MNYTLQHIELLNNRLFIFLTLLWSISFGQKHNIQNYTTKEGLSAQIVNGVFQDKSGFMWFATQSGVCYFDGRTFQTFEPDYRLAGIDAVSVIQDHRERLWIATNANGVFVYDFKKLKNYTEANGLPSNIVRSIFLDQQNTLWILSSKGVVKLVDEKLVKVSDSKGILDKGVLSMTQGKDGSYWFGTQGNYLVRLHNGEFSYLDDSIGVSDSYIFSLKTYGDSILIGTTNQGLLIYTNEQLSKLHVPEIENAWISNVVISGNTLNIVSSAGLIEYHPTEGYTIITEDNGLASNDLYHGAKDRENNIWLTSGNGVSLLRNEKVISFDESSGLSDKKITSITELDDGRLVVGTYGFGLNILDHSSKVIQQIRHPELMNIKITAIAYIPFKQELWIGAEQSEHGIVILDTRDNAFKVKKTIQKLAGQRLITVTKISSDKKKTVWVGAFNAGLFKIQKNDTIHYTKKDGLPAQEVYTFELDVNDRPWVSIYQKGVFVFDGKSFKPLSNQQVSSDKIVLSIAKDSRGNMYLGNKTHGLSVVSAQKTYTFKTSDGLLSNSIQAIVSDGNNLWLGSSLGLNKVTFSNAFEILKIETFNDKTGLLNSEIQQNGLFLTSDYVWIGSSTGLSSIEKQSKNRSLAKPLVRLHSIKLFYEEVDWRKKNVPVDKWGTPTELLLDYTENNLTFVFNAITATRVQYAYILENQDEEWTPYSDKNEVTFTNIAPGSYIFKIKAKNNVGIESEILSIPVTIKSPFWQTWWFRISFIAGIVIMIILVVRYREKQYKERQLRLEQVVKERTKEAVHASERAEHQRQLVEQKNKEILDSISYAKRIQTAMLPTLDFLREKISQIAVFYQPKDIVAGDFYWFEETNDFMMFAAADCTGHGVPGAMVSVVCYNALNRSVREYGLSDPGQILDKTREIILLELSKHDENVKDGMDISLLVLNKKEMQLSWAGANNPLWIVARDKHEVQEIKADKQPIGLHINSNNFTTQDLNVNEGDTLVLFTDGYADQFGGKNGKKFKSANLKRLIASNIHLSVDELQQTLVQTFYQWKGEEDQVDDVCVIVIRV